MNTSIFRTLVLALLMIPALSLFGGNGPIETYQVDASASKLVWKGYKVTGQHEGIIQMKSGEIRFQDGNLVGGQFTIDMGTIEVTDMEGEYADKLRNHLGSDDFFGAETYPTASLVITKVTALEDGEYTIEADLTIKEKTEKTTFTVTVAQAGNKIVADATMKIDRTTFDVRYGSPSFFNNLGDKAIYDEFDVTISLVAGK